MALRNIVVAVDFAVHATDDVVRRAALLTFAEGARLTLLHAVPSRLPHPLADSFRAAAETRLGTLADGLRETHGLRADLCTQVLVGSAAETIAAGARELDADLVVVGRGGAAAQRRGQLGSVAERLVRIAPAPVLVVHATPITPYLRPLVAVDLSPVSARVLATARAVADRAAACDVLYVHSAAYLRELHSAAAVTGAIDDFVAMSARACAHELRHLVGAASSDVTWRTIFRDGEARTLIPEETAACRADLVAVGATGHSIVSRLLVGSTTDAVLRSAPCDVLVVR